MEINKKVLAAISSAVGMYMIAEGEAMAAAQQQKRLAERPSGAYSPWAIAGRSAAMQARWTWQMRLAK